MAYAALTTPDKTCIYTLSDPTTGMVRYIGKANNPNSRLNRHMNESSICKRASWIKGLRNKGLKPVVEVLEEVDKVDWQLSEIYWIAQFKAWGFSLVNMCEGGLGQKEGHIPWNKGKKNCYSQDTIDRMKASIKNNFINADKNGMFKLSPSMHQNIKLAYESGISSLELAKKYNISQNQILKALRLLNVPICKKTKNGSVVKSNKVGLVRITDNIIVDYFAKNVESIRQIGVAFGLHHTTVSKVLLRSGISARKLRGRLPISVTTKKKMSESAKKILSHSRFIKGIVSHNAKSVFQLSMNGDFIKEWRSANEAKVALNVDNIRLCLHGKRNHAGGFKWKLKNN